MVVKFSNYFDYEVMSDFISMDELIENNIIEKPIYRDRRPCWRLVSCEHVLLASLIMSWHKPLQNDGDISLSSNE